jgi:hypothetical protein
MKTEDAQTKMIGFENDAGLGDLLKVFGLCDDYTAILPDHLAGILDKQHPGVVIDSIELLSEPGCRVGGVPFEKDQSLIQAQDMDATLMLCVTFHVDEARATIDIRLVLKCTGLDGTPKMESDMFVERQH